MMPTTNQSKQSDNNANHASSSFSGMRDAVRLRLHKLSTEARDRLAELGERLDPSQADGEGAGNGIRRKVTELGQELGQSAGQVLEQLSAHSDLDQTAAEVMQTARCCAPGDTLEDAARIMWQLDCGVVPITEDRRLVGVITDRDACMSAYLRGVPLADIAIQDVMSRDVHACSPDAALHDVLDVMWKHRCRRVPIVDQDILVGIVSLGDIARHVESQPTWESTSSTRVGRVLAAISMPRSDTEADSSASVD